MGAQGTSSSITPPSPTAPSPTAYAPSAPGGGKAGNGLQQPSYQRPIGLPGLPSQPLSAPYGQPSGYMPSQSQSPFAQGFGGAQSFQSPGFVMPQMQYQSPDISIPRVAPVSRPKPKPKPAPTRAFDPSYDYNQANEGP